MATEWGSATTVVEAETTLAIEFPKLALLLPDTGRMAGNVVVVPIGLNREFIDSAPSPYYYITDEWVESVRLPRPKFSHKGDYGHALLVCGSDDMPGAAILAAGGAVRSGCGLVTMRVPRSVRQPLIARHPSVMLASPDSTADDGLASPSGSTADAAPLARFAAIGVGPGLGRDPQTVAALRKLLTEASSPVVLDADALNIVAQNADMGELIPPGSVLTPHPGELKRLTGEWRSEREKLDMATELARKTASTVIVKGAHTVICTADGRLLFNSTGTPGMAKAGSGDVLTGLITGLVARGYDAQTASVIGVYAHGKAGEKAALLRGEEAMNASDLVDCL
jgi:NAD(P)H-hydrate epimerase